MNAFKNLHPLLLSGAIALTSFNAAAYDSNDQIIEANVVSAQPIYQVVQVNNPVQQCWKEAIPVHKKSYNSRTPEILGAIVGAGVGRLFGSGRGQDAATVAGAVLGGSIGRDHKNRKNEQYSDVRYEERCKVVDNFHTEERLQGYDVSYEYNGRIYNTRTKSDPGTTITVSVNVVPLES